MRYLLGAAALFLATPAVAADNCQLNQIASLELITDTTGRVDIPMSIAGETVNMMVDTGAVFSMLSEHVVQHFNLERHKMEHDRLLTIGGGIIDHYAAAHDVMLGPIKAPWLQMAIQPDSSASPTASRIDTRRILPKSSRCPWYSTTADPVASMATWFSNSPVRSIMPFTSV